VERGKFQVGGKVKVISAVHSEALQARLALGLNPCQAQRADRELWTRFEKQSLRNYHVIAIEEIMKTMKNFSEDCHAVDRYSSPGHYQNMAGESHPQL
jgi:hypothetical protein